MDSNRKPSLPGSRWKKSTSIALATLLVFSTAVFVWTIAPQNAYAAVTITSSSNKFFGNAFNRVLITDTALLGSPSENVTATVEARRGSTSLATDTVSVSEIGTSGTFELFLTTRSSGSPANPTKVPPVIERIHSTGDLATTLQDGDTIVVTYGGSSHTISFASTIATVTSDRTSAGTDNLITFGVNDPDGNNDPTAVDTLTATGIVQALIGTSDRILLSGDVFTETGQNTGIFELSLDVGGPAPGINMTGLTMPQSVTLRLTDHKVYAPIPGGATTGFTSAVTTTNTPAVSVTLENRDAIVSLVSPVTFANGIQPQINDPDRNRDTVSADTLGTANPGGVIITVEGVAGSVNAVDFEETSDNNGLFRALLSDNRIPINIGTSNSVGPSSITLTPNTIANNPDINILYMDTNGANNAAKNFTLVTSLGHTPGSLSGPAKVGVTDTFELEMNEPDLNTDPSTVQSYVVTLSGSTTNPTTFANGAADLRLRVKGNPITLASPLTLTFIETGANTGVFRATNIDMSIISSSTTLSDGDTVAFRYTDFLESPTTDSTATINVGKPGKGITVDRSTVPVPLPLLAATTTGGITFSAIGPDTVRVTIQVTDPVANLNSGSTDTVSIPTAAITGTLADGSTMTLGTHLVVNNNNAISLTETGVSTGVFSRTFDITPGTGTIAQLNGARIKFTYAGEVSVSVTFRLNDMAVSTDKGVVANGDTFIVTISDGDRNLDPGTKETIEFWLTAKNDDVGSPQSFTAEETGENTGIFVESVAVGQDIRVSDTTAQDFARNIEIKVRERVATDGTPGAIKERTITVTTATGTISIIPEVIGPGTKVTVNIRDFDNNANPEGTETITGSSDFVRIATDRTAVGSATPDAEETGPNTGSFEFELKMVPFTTGAVMTTSGTEVTVPALPGDVVAIRYTDNKDAAGNRVTVSRTFNVQSFDPEMKANVQTAQIGRSIELDIADADANVDGDVVDSIQLKIESTSDPVGHTVSALETGANTGVFRATITTSNQVEAGSIMVRTGDSLTIRYTDKYPADYATRVRQVVDPSKDFELHIPVGTSAGDARATTPSQPAVRDAQGAPISQVLAGSQVVLASTIVNNESAPRPYAAIVEVRDSNDVTIYLQWQTGVLPASGSSNVGISWTPEEPGRYTVRVFVLSDLARPQILSAIVTSTVNVS